MACMHEVDEGSHTMFVTTENRVANTGNRHQQHKTATHQPHEPVSNQGSDQIANLVSFYFVVFKDKIPILNFESKMLMVARCPLFVLTTMKAGRCGNHAYGFD